MAASGGAATGSTAADGGSGAPKDLTSVGAALAGETDAFASADRAVTTFATFEDYLSSQITELDMFYLGDEELARKLVEMGQRGFGDTMKREDFEARKKAEKEKHMHRDAAPQPLASVGKDLSGKPLLQELASREELVRNGKLTCILYIRDKNARGQEISGYVDLTQRLRTESFEPYFSGRKRLLPRPTDLSFYNFDTQASTSNSSPTFQVIADNEAGLMFKNKRDRKVINVDPDSNPGDNTTRLEVTDASYTHIVIYDHFTRRKG